MDASCRQARNELPEGRHGPGWGAPGMRELCDHVHACGACAEWMARAERRHALLHSVPRLAAPRALDARVEQALGAAGRNERIEDALRSLGRQRSPAQLESAVEALAGPGLSGPRAPEVLARLVGEELADPRKARARRFLGGLQRLRAPGRLAHLVALEIARATSSAPRRRPAAPRAAAALLLASVVIAALALPNARRPASQPRAMPRVEPLASAADLDPFARGLLDAFSGGVLSAGSH